MTTNVSVIYGLCCDRINLKIKSYADIRHYTLFHASWYAIVLIYAIHASLRLSCVSHEIYLYNYNLLPRGESCTRFPRSSRVHEIIGFYRVKLLYIQLFQGYTRRFYPVKMMDIENESI